MERGKVGGGPTLQDKLAQPEFRRWADDLMVRLTLDAAPPWPEDGMAWGKQEQRLRRAAADPLYFCRTYLAHHFSQVPAPFHYELVHLLERRPGAAAADLKSPGARPEDLEAATPIVAAVPREFGKTTLCAFGYVLHQICFRRRRFIAIGAESEERASDLTGRLYLELLYNQKLHLDFGELAPADRPVDDFVTANGVRVKARGRGRRLQGLQFAAERQKWRPDLIILDDPEGDLYGKHGKSGADASLIAHQVLEWVQEAALAAQEAGARC